jgi:erythromycin esterase-like protein
MVAVPVGEVPEAVARIARPIYGEDELDQLIDLLGNARFVLLGEASHGTHEFYDLRASLTRKLISERGFAAVTIEGDWPDALRVDRYVRFVGVGDDETANEALAGFRRFPQWMWRNRDVESFVEWLRAYNGSRLSETRAGFYGLDLYSLHASIAAVLSYLDEIDPAAAERARQHYGCFDHVEGDLLRYGIQAQFGIVQDCEDEVVAQLVEVQRRRAAGSGRSPSGDAWFNAMVNAHLVRDAEAYYRAMFGRHNDAWNRRDTHMADALDLLADQLGQEDRRAKLIVWAHDSHVGDARASALGHDGQTSLGTLMRERHPDEVALVGFTTHTGTVACAHDWDEAGMREHVQPSLPGSWEELFHDAGIARFMVTSAALKRSIGERSERLHRAIGVVYRPETERRSHYYHSRLADQYDIVVHIDETHAVQPLEPPAPPPEAETEPPETYPSGI